MIKTKKVIVPVHHEDFIGDMEYEISVQCLACNHFSDLPITCKAFREGIPDRILAGEFDHRKPYSGDNGIRFEPLEKPE